MRRDQMADSAAFMAKCHLENYLKESKHGYISGASRGSAYAYKHMELLLRGEDVVKAGNHAQEWIKEAEAKLEASNEQAKSSGGG